MTSGTPRRHGLVLASLLGALLLGGFLDEQWTVPIQLGVSKVFKFGKLRFRPPS